MSDSCPNDAISREAAIEAVRESIMAHFTSVLAGEMVVETVSQSLASLPADTRWEELRALAMRWRARAMNERAFGVPDDSAPSCRCSEELVAILDRLAPAPAEARKLDPEGLKTVLRQALSGCGPMAIVYAEAAINEMAGIESPREE